MYRRDDGLDVHFSTARDRASKSYTKPIMSSSSTPSESNQCSPMSCAGAANVSLSCLADPQCLCADSTAALAVWNCLFNVCTLTDVTLARTTLLLQCQAIGEDFTKTASSPTTTNTSTPDFSTRSNTLSACSTATNSPTPSSSIINFSGLPSLRIPSQEPSRTSSPAFSSNPAILSITSVPVPATPSMGFPRTSILSFSSSTSNLSGTKARNTGVMVALALIPVMVILGVGILAALGAVVIRRRRRRRPVHRTSVFEGNPALSEEQSPRDARSVNHTDGRRHPTAIWLSQSNYAQYGSDLASDAPQGVQSNNDIEGNNRRVVRRIFEAFSLHPKGRSEIPEPYILVRPSYASPNKSVYPQVTPPLYSGERCFEVDETSNNDTIEPPPRYENREATGEYNSSEGIVRNRSK